jgi:hypothetical protein
MAGTLTISTLSDGTNSTSSTNCIQGSAKAWVNFNGTGTPAIRGSFNVSSVTKGSTGVYTITITNALPTTNSAYVVAGKESNSNSDQSSLAQPFSINTSSFGIRCVAAAVAPRDFEIVNASVFSS